MVLNTQVSFATVVLGLSRRGDAPAGRKAIKLYDSMRRDFKFVPDEVCEDTYCQLSLREKFDRRRIFFFRLVFGGVGMFSECSRSVSGV